PVLDLSRARNRQQDVLEQRRRRLPRCEDLPAVWRHRNAHLGSVLPLHRWRVPAVPGRGELHGTMDVTRSLVDGCRTSPSDTRSHEVPGGIETAKAGSGEAESRRARPRSLGTTTKRALGRRNPPTTASHALRVDRTRPAPKDLYGTLRADGKGPRADVIRRACSETRARKASDAGEGIRGAGGASAP